MYDMIISANGMGDFSRGIEQHICKCQMKDECKIIKVTQTIKRSKQYSAVVFILAQLSCIHER